MTKELSLELWENQKTLEQIKQTFAPKISDTEFALFIGLGKATGLNPFLKEIWAVPYGGGSQIFIGRDGYRKGAQRHQSYDYHQVDAVYSNDVFEMNNGIPTHSYKIGNRGTLVGAYCVVQRKGSSKPVFIFVEMREYAKSFGVWKEKPATMIKKVAEAQGLRMAFQDLFGGSYDESEAWEEEKVTKNITPTPVSLKAPTNKSLVEKEMRAVSSEYENVTDEDMRMIYRHLMSLSLLDSDIPLAVREEFDSKFQKKAINAE